MRALWLVRSNLQSEPGGDTTQILETASILRQRGVTVELSSALKPDLRGFDVVHLFHLDRLWENVNWCAQIRAAEIPSVLSPIYWPTEEFDRLGHAGLRSSVLRWGGTRAYHNLKLVHHAALHTISRVDPKGMKVAAFGYGNGRRYILDTVKVLLPNSIAERDELKRQFGEKRRMIITPNAANGRAFSPPTERTDDNPDRDDGSVLSVGRIEPRKNQLTLIRALKNSGLRLRIIGRADRASRGYARQCRLEAGPEVEFLSWRTPEELRHWYRVSGVHVSTSWYETPGLASLEAACCGCPIVVTRGGSTREYFADDAEYCAPANPESIRRAIGRAMVRPRLNGRLSRTFTWDDAARITVEAYEKAGKPAESCDQPLAAHTGS